MSKLKYLKSIILSLIILSNPDLYCQVEHFVNFQESIFGGALRSKEI